jgi:hypothetical protein
MSASIPEGSDGRNSSDRVPAWMVPFGIKEGDWFHGSKPALRAGMRPTFSLKTRVWCCGMLHTHAYQNECALKMFRNKKVPFTAGDLARELYRAGVVFYEENGQKLTDEQKKALEVSKQHIRRILSQLEQEGCGDRRTSEGVLLRDLSVEQLKRLPKGSIRLYFYARPRVVDSLDLSPFLRQPVKSRKPSRRIDSWGCHDENSPRN